MSWPTILLLILAADGKSSVDKPVLFNTKEADAIVSTMQIFPSDNP